MTLPTLYTTAEIAKALRCSEDKVRDLVAEGKVRPYRLDGSPRSPMRFSEAHYQELLAALQQRGRPVLQPNTRRRRARRSP